MAKGVRCAFTGVAVVSPSFPGTAGPFQGPIRAVMPESRRARKSLDKKAQVDALFSFVIFRTDQLDDASPRQPDYRFKDKDQLEHGICFLHREKLVIEKAPAQHVMYDVSNEAEEVPTKDSKHAKWIPCWERFAPKAAKLLNVSSKKHDIVEVELPGGKISSRFIGTPRVKVDYQYDNGLQKEFFAHEMVVEVALDDVATVTLRSEFGSQPTDAATDLVFKISNNNLPIDLLFGNGALAAIDAIIHQGIAGRDHDGLIDYEFEAIYDVVVCREDKDKRKPVPKLSTREIRIVPCVVSTIEPAQRLVTDNESDAMRNISGTEPPDRDDRHQIVVALDKWLLAYKQQLGGSITPVPEAIAQIAFAANRVCRISEEDEPNFATGFLVGKNLVMSAAHAFFDDQDQLFGVDPARFVFQFDNLEVGEAAVVSTPATAARVAGDDWLFYPQVDSTTRKPNRPIGKLDYVIIRLDRDVASDIVGKRKRGCFEVRPLERLPEIDEGFIVRTLQYVDRGPLCTSAGAVKALVDDGMTVQYTASTLDAASGGPIGDDEFRLIGVHGGAGDGVGEGENDGVPIAQIVRDLMAADRFEELQTFTCEE